MNWGDQTIKTLREAVRVSPDNLPLRQHLADTLLQYGLAEDAEKEYLEGLRLDPGHVFFKVGLARAFSEQGKVPQALLIVEPLVQDPVAPPAAHFLCASLLLRTGATDRAREEYDRAIDADPSLADPDLAKQLRHEASQQRPTVEDEKVRLLVEGTEGPFRRETERSTISFRDVGGMEALKEEIRMKIIHPLTHPEIFQAYGKKIGGGILMFGPPGCGKTHLARATAGEVQAEFLSVGLHDILDMWLGQSEKNLHELFEQARAKAPCVLFFDEVDALGASRGDMRQSSGRHLINQFLSELDGIQYSNEGVLILAATNAPWHVDSAFRRPGRFDRILFVPPPDTQARESILRIMCQAKPVVDLDFVKVARLTEHFSGADLKALVESAIEQKLGDAMKAGVLKPLTTKDLTSACQSINPSTKEWFSTARNYALYSNQGGIYDDILRYLKV